MIGALIAGSAASTSADPADAESARVAANHGFRIVDVRPSLVAHGRSSRLARPAAETVEVREATETTWLRTKTGGEKPPGAASTSTAAFRAAAAMPSTRHVEFGEAGIRTAALRPADGRRAGRVSRGRPSRSRARGDGELVAIHERYRGKGLPGAALLHLPVTAARGAITQRGRSASATSPTSAFTSASASSRTRSRFGITSGSGDGGRPRASADSLQPAQRRRRGDAIRG